MANIQLCYQKQDTIRNIREEATLKCSNEALVLAGQMRVPCSLLGVTRLDEKRNADIRNVNYWGEEILDAQSKAGDTSCS